jgi:hypothetical protein
MTVLRAMLDTIDEFLERGESLSQPGNKGSSVGMGPMGALPGDSELGVGKDALNAASRHGLRENKFIK